MEFKKIGSFGIQLQHLRVCVADRCPILTRVPLRVLAASIAQKFTGEIACHSDILTVFVERDRLDVVGANERTDLILFSD